MWRFLARSGPSKSESGQDSYLAFREHIMEQSSECADVPLKMSHFVHVHRTVDALRMLRIYTSIPENCLNEGLGPW